MEDKPLSKQVGDLCQRLASVGLSTIATILNKAIGDHSIAEHEQWDDKTRSEPQDKVIDALSEGIHTPPKQGLEMAPSDVRSVEDLPPLDLGTFPDAQSNTELRALEVTKSLRRDGKKVLVSNPGRLVSGVVALLWDEAIWRAYGAQLRMENLFDELVLPIRARLKRVTSKDNLLRLSCHAAQLYGVKVDTVSVEHLLRGAPDFIDRSGSETALTMSASSGIVDPLERFGTKELLDLLDLQEGSDIAESVRRKSPWRVINFRDGLLNPRFDARVLHFFDCRTTADALCNTLAILPEDRKERYKRLAARLLQEALECPRFELYAVESFAPWMWRYSRSAPGHVLIVFRHPETRTISEGLELNFKDLKGLHRWFERVFRWGGTIPLPPLQLSVMAAAELEGLLFSHIQEKIIRDRVEHDVLTASKRVLLDDDSPKAKDESAYRFIEELVVTGEHDDT